MMKIITNSVASLFLLLSCSGCFMLTHSVANIGVRNEILVPQRILVSSNGAIALECSAEYVHPSEPPRHIYKTKKYLVGSPEVACWTVSNSIASVKAISFSKSLTNAAVNRVSISKFVYASTNKFNWILITARRGGRDATPSDLPAEFRTPSITCPASSAVPYDSAGLNLQLHFPEAIYNKRRDSRCWWGYPGQVLIIPAIAIDIVGVPVEFCIGAKEFGRAFN